MKRKKGVWGIALDPFFLWHVLLHISTLWPLDIFPKGRSILIFLAQGMRKDKPGQNNLDFISGHIAQMQDHLGD